MAKLWASAAVAAGVAWGVKLAAGHHDPIRTAIAVLAPYSAVYFAMTYLLRVEECAGAIGRLARLRR